MVAEIKTLELDSAASSFPVKGVRMKVFWKQEQMDTQQF